MDQLVDKPRKKIQSVMASLAKALDRQTGGKITPTMITYFGLFMHIPIALLIASGDFLAAAILLIIFGLFDALDGALARVQNSTSHMGMFIDSATDRVKEILLYTALAYYFVSVYTAAITVWVVAACGAALLVSYMNAWGEVATNKAQKNKNHSVNKSFRGGIMSFDIRILTLIIGLLANRPDIAIILIAVFSVLTALQRYLLIIKRLA